MAPRNWTNGGGTPLSAANLNALEAELAAKAEKTLATAAVDGLMPKADKAKLDGGTASATPNTVVVRNVGGTSAFNEVILTGQSATNSATRRDYVDAQVGTRAASGHTHADATPAVAGFLSTADKARLDDIQLGATIIPTDLSTVAGGSWGLDTSNIPTGSTASYTTTVNRRVTSGASDPIPFDETRTYRYSFKLHSNIVGQVTYFEMGWATKANGGLGALPRILGPYTVPANTWTAFSGLIGQGTGIVPPAGTAKINPFIYANHASGTTGGVLSIADFTLVDVTDTVAYASNKAPLSVMDFGALGDGTTNNNTAIQAAVDAAIAQGRELYWPLGTYLKTVNILNFHTVKHRGQGIVKHGTDLFYVEPRGIQANTLYVSTTGASDTYDGLSSSFPLRTVNKATAHLFNYGPVLQGFWAIQLAAGTYSDRVKDLNGLGAVAPPTIRGPIVNHPNVPTAMFSEGYNIGAVAIDLSDAKTGFVISNIRFEGYNGTSSSAGVKASATGTESYLINCHFTDNYWGVTCQSSAMDMKGGILTRNGYLGNTANNVAESSRSGNGAGYRGLMGSRHSIGTQNSGDLLKGPYFINNVSGVFVQETCTGHVDYCRFEDNDIAVNANVNSRANVDGSSFLRNKIALRGISNCHFFVSTATVFGTGVDENGIPFSLAQGSQMTDSSRLFTDVSQSYNIGLKIIDTVFPDQTVQTTSLTTVYTATLAGYAWRDVIDLGHERKRLVFKVFGSLAGTAGTKAIVLRLGTANVTATFTATEVGVFEVEATIFFKDVAAQMLYMKASRHLGTGGRFALTQATNALTANTACTVEASVGVATDSVVINAIDVAWA